MNAQMFLSAREIAQRLGCSVRTVRRWIAEGTLPSVRIGGLRRVSVADLDRFLSVEIAFLQADIPGDWRKDREPMEEFCDQPNQETSVTSI